VVLDIWDCGIVDADRQGRMAFTTALMNALVKDSTSVYRCKMEYKDTNGKLIFD